RFCLSRQGVGVDITYQYLASFTTRTHTLAILTKPCYHIDHEQVGLLSRWHPCPAGRGCTRATSRAIQVDQGTVALRGVSLWDAPRSEEHTSELQSRGHLVCR